MHFHLSGYSSTHPHLANPLLHLLPPYSVYCHCSPAVDHQAPPACSRPAKTPPLLLYLLPLLQASPSSPAASSPPPCPPSLTVVVPSCRHGCALLQTSHRLLHLMPCLVLQTSQSRLVSISPCCCWLCRPACLYLPQQHPLAEEKQLSTNNKSTSTSSAIQGQHKQQIPKNISFSVDLAQALYELKSSTQLALPLVVFGHMHKALAYGGERKMVVVGTDGTIYLNGAIVPRVKSDSGRGSEESAKTGTLRAFTFVEILDGRVEKISETWVLVDESRIAVQEESTLFQSSHNGASA